MYRVPPTTVSARIATATGRQAQVSDRRGETPVAVKRGARVSWFSFTGDEGPNPSPSSGEADANLTSSNRCEDESRHRPTMLLACLYVPCSADERGPG